MKAILESLLTEHDRLGIGTPLYMSPEQIESKAVDGRSGLYAQRFQDSRSGSAGLFRRIKGLGLG